MNKQSLRKEIDKLQEESQKILFDKSLSKETKLFIQSMLTIVTIMITLFLEKKTRKNSSNSGLPPSQNFGSNGNRNTQGSNFSNSLEFWEAEIVRQLLNAMVIHIDETSMKVEQKELLDPHIQL